MGWLWLQCLPGLPAAWVHAAWAFAPDPAARAISADPSEGRLITMRLICYGLVFLLLVRSARSGWHATMFLRAFALLSALLAARGLVDALSTGEPVTASLVNRNSYATLAGFGALANLAVLRQMSGRAGTGDPAAALRRVLDGLVRGGWLPA